MGQTILRDISSKKEIREEAISPYGDKKSFRPR